MKQRDEALAHVNGEEGVLKVVNAVYKEKEGEEEGLSEADLKKAVLENSDFSKLKFF